MRDIIDDVSQEDTDSEYWAAVEDEDLSDATVRTGDGSEEEGGCSDGDSDGDFH